MKKDTHPSNYRPVVFKDLSNDETFIVRSCANTRETIVAEDGNEYPLVKLEISNKSHPFFTGKMNFVDTAGRIEKFNNKFSRFSKRKQTATTETVTPETAAAETATPDAAK
jgi:large subunit ribosomal protein L31